MKAKPKTMNAKQGKLMRMAGFRLMSSADKRVTWRLGELVIDWGRQEGVTVAALVKAVAYRAGSLKEASARVTFGPLML